jgi:hypothetical protein
MPKKRRAPSGLIEYGEALGYTLVRLTTNGRRAQLEHKQTKQPVIVPLYSYDLGRDIINFRTMLHRGSKG